MFVDFCSLMLGGIGVGIGIVFGLIITAISGFGIWWLIITIVEFLSKKD